MPTTMEIRALNGGQAVRLTRTKDYESSPHFKKTEKTIPLREYSEPMRMSFFRP